MQGKSLSIEAFFFFFFYDYQALFDTTMSSNELNPRASISLVRPFVGHKGG